MSRRKGYVAEERATNHSTSTLEALRATFDFILLSVSLSLVFSPRNARAISTAFDEYTQWQGNCRFYVRSLGCVLRRGRASGGDSEVVRSGNERQGRDRSSVLTTAMSDYLYRWFVKRMVYQRRMVEGTVCTMVLIASVEDSV